MHSPQEKISMIDDILENLKLVKELGEFYGKNRFTLQETHDERVLDWSFVWGHTNSGHGAWSMLERFEKGLR